MRWFAPESLWLLVAVLLVAVGFLLRWRRRSRLLRSIGDEALLRRMAQATSLPAQIGRAVLVVLALILIVLALARPQLGGAEVRSEKRGIDLVVALDVSRSMDAQDIRPSRLQAARLSLESLLPRLTGSRVGLVPFSGVAFPQCPLTSDQAAIRGYLRGMGSGQLPVGGTALGRAITEAAEVLTGRRKLAEAAKRGRELKPLHRARTQAILLLTDGEDHTSDPIAAAEQAAEDGIKIFTVGMATRAGELIPLFNPDGSLQGYRKDRSGKVVRSQLDEETLRTVASKTGGRYLPFDDPADPRPLPVRLHGVLDSLEKEAMGDSVRRHMDERYAFLLGPALLLLALELVIGDRRRRRA